MRKKISIAVGIAILLGLPTLFFIKRSMRIAKSPAKVRYLFTPSIPTKDCDVVVKEQKDICETSPMTLLAQTSNKSSSLQTLGILVGIIGEKNQLGFSSNGNRWHTQIPIPWDTDPFSNRSWKMSLEGLRILDGYFHHFKKTQDEKDIRTMYSIILDWYDFHVIQKKQSEFAWNDMSVAARADRLSKFLDMVSTHAGLFSDREIRRLLTISDIHLGFLTDPKNLNTDNHGLFEIASLARLCHVGSFFSKCQNIEPWLLQSTDMLTKNQFGPNGLQLEHSFEYHTFVGELYDHLLEENILPFSKTSLELFARTKDAEKWLRDPLGNLVPVGDTAPEEHADVSEKYFSDHHIKIFQQEGLAVARTPSSGLWFYAFHHSKSHKHDDDLAFYLIDHNESLLIDAGKYTYLNNEKRKYVYSRYAHNTMIIPGLPTPGNRKPYGSGIQSIEQVGNEYVANGEVAYENGITHRRTLHFLPGKQLIINDVIHGISKDNVKINFLLAPDLEFISTKGNISSFKSKHTNLTIEMMQGCSAETYKGYDKDRIMYGWYTKKYGALEPTNAVILTCPNQRKIVTKIEY